MRVRLRALAVVALLATAGCVAPAGDAQTATGEEGIRYAGGSIPADPDAVYAAVQATLGTDAGAPETVRVVASPADLPGRVAGTALPRFWRVAGVTPASGLDRSDVERLENGVTSGLGTIAVYPGREATAADRRLLAHEFVHYVQLATGGTAAVQRALPIRTTDGQYVARGVLEGAAVFATDAYVARHAAGLAPNAHLYRELNRSLTPGSLAWHVNLAYVEGREYVAARVGDPADLGAVYESPPPTAERLIHEDSADVPRPLGVAVNGTEWRVAARDRLGEAFVRTALAGGAGVGRATRAAAGWGEDTLFTLRRPAGANASHVWALRWDRPADAAEFLAAFEASLAARGERRGEGWRVAGATVATRRANATTTLVLAGPAAFVNETTATGDDGSVTVRVA